MSELWHDEQPTPPHRLFMSDWYRYRLWTAGTTTLTGDGVILPDKDECDEGGFGVKPERRPADDSEEDQDERGD